MADHDPDFQRFLGPDRRSIPRPRGTGAVVAVIAVIVVAAVVIMWPRGSPALDLSPLGLADDVVPAEVTVAVNAACSYSPDLRCRSYQVVVTPEAGGDFATLEFPDEAGQPDLREGDRVFLARLDGDGGDTVYQYAGQDRNLVLVVLGLVFAAAVVALGRLRGFAALFALVGSVGLLVWFILPAMVAGQNAVLVAIAGGGLIALLSLYLAHGLTPLTHVAALGIFGALGLTALLSWVAVATARLTGFVGEESFLLSTLPDLDLSGLLLAGVVLGAIGALDDVTVTQASAVWEVHNANPSLPAEELFRAGIRVGRDHIVSTVNTLLLAYAGAALPLLLLFSLADQTLGFVASSEIIATEIVRTLVGSIGLVAAVPLTTWLAARVAASVPTRVSP